MGSVCACACASVCVSHYTAELRGVMLVSVGRRNVSDFISLLPASAMV